MIDKVTLNARKPGDNEYGLAMLNRMNDRHRPLHSWGLEHIDIKNSECVLDIGFGGGQNINNICVLSPYASVYGIDYSEASLKKCSELNREYIESGRVNIITGSADKLPYDNDKFDTVTAFETIYYWPVIDICFQNIHRVLKKDGVFLICNEDSSHEGNEEIADVLDMKFYNEKELRTLLEKAGFSEIRVYPHENGRWICAVAVK